LIEKHNYFGSNQSTNADMTIPSSLKSTIETNSIDYNYDYHRTFIPNTQHMLNPTQSIDDNFNQHMHFSNVSDNIYNQQQTMSSQLPYSHKNQYKDNNSNNMNNNDYNLTLLSYLPLNSNAMNAHSTQRPLYPPFNS